jgi:hypothetical protein
MRHNENIKLIALNGPKGVGKTTVASALRYSLRNRGFFTASILSFAGPIKAMAKTLGVPESYLIDPALKEEEIPGLGVSSRVLMQTLGTEWGRQMISDQIWLWAMTRAIEKDHKGLDDNEIHFIIIDDCRFDNEADYVTKHGGIVIQLERLGVKYTGEHSSESALTEEVDCRVDCDYVADAVRSILNFTEKEFNLPFSLR